MERSKKTDEYKIENISNINPEDQLRLARLLLIHYGILHPFIQFQLERYIIACCNISVGGEVKIDGLSKIVIYDIKTKKRLSILKPFYAKKYKKEVELAKTNLEIWTKALLWGDDTTVKVYIDGKEV